MVRVLELARIPSLGHVVDETLGERDFLRIHAGGLESFRRQLDAARRTKLVRVAQRDQHQRPPVRDHGREMLCGTDDDLRDRDAMGALQGFAQKRVHLVAACARCKIVGRLVVFGRNLLFVHECLDVDRLRRLYVGAPEILVGEHDILVLFVFVALDDVLPRDFLAGRLAVAIVADRREVALVEHRELERLAVLGGIELDGNVDQAERDRSFPQRARHLILLLSPAPACTYGGRRRRPPRHARGLRPHRIPSKATAARRPRARMCPRHNRGVRRRRDQWDTSASFSSTRRPSPGERFP